MSGEIVPFVAVLTYTFGRNESQPFGFLEHERDGVARSTLMTIVSVMLLPILSNAVNLIEWMPELKLKLIFPIPPSPESGVFELT